ncbi:hypothetical protein [Actinocrispum wychmicini]|uniref:hypothetical protein n=1 Tax=Actinocrispum wychmicini TaxID=1213861 RepID=UPI0010437EA3|nr:hypothetical protein [Actinocrispum wychmicini]
MNEDELIAKLAVLLRGVQWAADDMAFRLPTGRVTDGDLIAFADQLSVVANLLRAHAAGTPSGDE